MKRLNKQVFWPPFLLLSFSTLFSLIDGEQFIQYAVHIQNSILHYFDWLFNWSTFLFLILVIVIYFSPLAKVRIGGEAAQPILPKWKWFSVLLCTTIATGILFWGTAEPLFHYNEPPESLGLQGPGEASKVFAMSSMYMHWTFTPYATYTLAAVMFALVFYNMQQPFRLSSLLFPLFKLRPGTRISAAIDSICLFALVSGMAASLGAGILTISGGLNHSFGVAQNSVTWGLIAISIVASFVLSASTGLLKGIKILSDINFKIFIALALFFLLFGPTTEMISIGFKGLVDYATNFIPRSTNLYNALDRSWTQSWTSFYLANWIAWTPVTALFLGRLGVGYTVKEFIRYNLFLPALFSAAWMIIFSGTALHFDSLSNDSHLFQILVASGPQNVIYELFNELPMGNIISYLFVIVVFISFTTAADSNTSAMSGLSTHGITPENPEAPYYIKLLWGIIIGVVSWVMISFSGIDGIKMISVIGGFPALFLLILVFAGMIRLIINPRFLQNFKV